MKITIIAGTRPNFIKIAPIIAAIKANQQTHNSLSYRLVHTGQHFDEKMSATFFEQLNIPIPDVNLACGGGTQAEQTGAIMVAFEKELTKNPCDLVIVVGDVTSTMACTIVAKKLHTKVAHVEAGIRSGDISMPEEVNRLVTDALTDYFFTTTTLASNNLLKAGVNPENIYFVGNVMIDTLVANQVNFKQPLFWEELQLQEKKYIVLTLHRPANVDDSVNLKNILNEVITHSENLPIIFPIHPRTASIFKQLHISSDRLKVIDPQGYLEFNYLVKNSFAVITDSGGITEETSFMKVPCITLRDNTERPETVTVGTNMLIGTNPKAIQPTLELLFTNQWKKGKIPEKWDGKTAERIIEVIVNNIKKTDV